VRLGWDFVGLIDWGRIKEYADDEEAITRVFRHQLAACAYEVLPRPGRLLRWGVPASRGHDDLLVSAALTTRSDQIDWRPRLARGSGAANRVVESSPLALDPAGCAQCIDNGGEWLDTAAALT
jgi:hypothetical protein